MNTPIRMSNENENERIDLDKYASMPIGGIFGVTFDQLFSDVERHEDGGVTTKPLNLSLTQMEAVKDLPKLIAELKRCYEEIDSLPAREALNKMHDYTKWLERVESYFLADGSFNQDADFVRMCAVNNKCGYRIEVIDGVETVVHESEWHASE